jgi:hypothetical protein
MLESISKAHSVLANEGLRESERLFKVLVISLSRDILVKPEQPLCRHYGDVAVLIIRPCLIRLMTLRSRLSECHPVTSFKNAA